MVLYVYNGAASTKTFQIIDTSTTPAAPSP
jgi:hypothetical protein